MHAMSLIVRSIAVALAAAVAAPCGAQFAPDPSVLDPAPDGVKRHPAAVVDLRTVPEKDSRPIDPYAYRRGLFSSLGLYEYKRLGEEPGQYTRPHYALGLHSELMRDALSLTGLEAENCVAPMVRMRARQTTITGASGISMTVLARCSFH
jgi:hypothetical protein